MCISNDNFNIFYPKIKMDLRFYIFSVTMCLYFYIYMETSNVGMICNYKLLFFLFLSNIYWVFNNVLQSTFYKLRSI